MHLTDGSMVQGEVFESGEFLFEGLGTDSVTVMPDTDTIKIIRPSDNADVTECYDIKAEERGIIILTAGTKRFNLSLKSGFMQHCSNWR